MSGESLLACYAAEFGSTAVTDMWRMRTPRTAAQFATWLDLRYPETLPLWFGAIALRLKKTTFKALWTHVKGTEGDAFDYAAILEC
jgi:hypothetical protein